MAERIIRFTFLVNSTERQLIASIAKRLCRTQGDALRILICRAADELGVDDLHHERVKSETEGENDG